MAARVIVTGVLGKRFVNRIWAARDPAPPAVASSRFAPFFLSSFLARSDVAPTNTGIHALVWGKTMDLLVHLKALKQFLGHLLTQESLATSIKIGCLKQGFLVRISYL